MPILKRRRNWEGKGTCDTFIKCFINYYFTGYSMWQQRCALQTQISLNLFVHIVFHTLIGATVLSFFLEYIKFVCFFKMNGSTCSYCILVHSVCHTALKFIIRTITNWRVFTQRCILHCKVNWPVLSTEQLCHWYILLFSR